MDMRKIPTRHLQPHRLGAGGKQQRIVRVPSAVRELHAPVRRVDGGNARLQLQVYALLAIEATDRSGLDSSGIEPARKPFDRLGRSQGTDSSALSIVSRPA